MNLLSARFLAASTRLVKTKKKSARPGAAKTVKKSPLAAKKKKMVRTLKQTSPPPAVRGLYGAEVVGRQCEVLFTMKDGPDEWYAGRIVAHQRTLNNKNWLQIEFPEDSKTEWLFIEHDKGLRWIEDGSDRQE
jgi:hypothetical protein